MGLRLPDVYVPTILSGQSVVQDNFVGLSISSSTLKYIAKLPPWDHQPLPQYMHGYYRSVPGKVPMYVGAHNSQFLPALALTWDIMFHTSV
jgi:hypothetical protein